MIKKVKPMVAMIVLFFSKFIFLSILSENLNAGNEVANIHEQVRKAHYECSLSCFKSNTYKDI